jgi:hypothetical protein
VSFLSRSTQESGFSDKKKRKDQKIKATQEVDKKPISKSNEKSERVKTELNRI